MAADYTGNGSRLAWYCFRTRTKREHLAAGQIKARRELDVCCPRLRYDRPTRRGRVRFTEAVFPGYIFVRCRIAEDLRFLLSISGVISVVRYGMAIPTLPDCFIEDLRNRLGGDCREVPEAKLNPGTEVVILKGPFLNLRAIVDGRVPGVRRVALLFDFLGRRIRVEMPEESVMSNRLSPKMEVLAAT